MKVAGYLLLLAGAAIGFYALMIFKISYGDVVNLGLLSDRQNLLIVAGCVAVVGALFAVLGSSSAEPSDPVERAYRDFKRFYAAMESGDVGVMEQMLKDGAATPNGQSKEGLCWLRLCVMADAEVACNLLISWGADVNLADGSGLSPIAYVNKYMDRLGKSAPKFLTIFESALRSKALFASGELSQTAAAQPNGTAKNVPEQLAELARLHREGHLSNDQFEVAKNRVLACS